MALWWSSDLRARFARKRANLVLNWVGTVYSCCSECLWTARILLWRPTILRLAWIAFYVEFEPY